MDRYNFRDEDNVRRAQELLDQLKSQITERARLKIAAAAEQSNYSLDVIPAESQAVIAPQHMTGAHVYQVEGGWQVGLSFLKDPSHPPTVFGRFNSDAITTREAAIDHLIDLAAMVHVSAATQEITVEFEFGPIRFAFTEEYLAEADSERVNLGLDRASIEENCEDLFDFLTENGDDRESVIAALKIMPEEVRDEACCLAAMAFCVGIDRWPAPIKPRTLN